MEVIQATAEPVSARRWRSRQSKDLVATAEREQTMNFVGAVRCAHAIGDLILKFLSALFSLNLPEQLLPLLTFLVILFHGHARLSLEALERRFC